MIADDNYIPPTPEECAARAADPVWLAAQAAKRQAAEDRFAARRAEIGQPLTQKRAGERF